VVVLVFSAFRVRSGQKRTSRGSEHQWGGHIEGLDTVVRFDETVNAQSTIELLKNIEARHPMASKIYLFCDNARYCRSRLVKGYLQGSKIVLVLLPPYCPNLI